MSAIGPHGLPNFMDASALRKAAEKPAAGAGGSQAAESQARASKSGKGSAARSKAGGKGSPEARAEGPSEGKEEKEWTVLLYLNGNNSLSGQAISTLRQLEFTGSDENMDWVAQVSRPKGGLDRFSKDWSGTRRYHIEHNGKELTPGDIISGALLSWLPGQTKKITSKVTEDLGPDVDMGKAQTFEEFVEWGMKNYPARRTMVVMMGPSQGLSGMMKDTTTGSEMTVPELGAALENIHEKTGRKIDVLTVNGSATNTMELAYEIKDHVQYLVGSQGLQSGAGMPFGQIAGELKKMNEDGAQDALTMTRFITLMNSMAGAQITSTISAIDLTRMDEVKGAWDELGKQLLAAKVPGDKIRALLDETQDFQGRSKNLAYQNSRDAYHFAELVFNDPSLPQPELKAAAQGAMQAIEGSLVGDAASGKYVSDAHGMSIFGPTHYGYFRPDGTPVSEDWSRKADYDKTDFARDTSWDEILTTAAQDSAFNRAAKTLGLSETALDKIHATVDKGTGKARTALGFASMLGWMNALNAWGGRPAAGFAFLQPTHAVYAGVAGSAYDAYQAVDQMVYAARELKDGEAVASGGFDLARAGAKAVANLGYVVPTLAPYAATAGSLMFFSPWLRNVYGVYQQYKTIKDGIELSNEPLGNQLGLAVARHMSDKQLWDK